MLCVVEPNWSLIAGPAACRSYVSEIRNYCLALLVRGEIALFALAWLM